MVSITKALNEATDAEGGYTVPEIFSRKMYDIVTSSAVVLNDLETVRMESNIVYFPKVTSGTTAYWVDETASITESQPGFGRITLTAKKIASLVPASSEVLEDNNVQLANYLVERMAKDLGLQIDYKILMGGCTTANNTGATDSPFAGLYHTASYVNAVDAAGNTNKTGAWGTGSSVTASNITLKAISQAVVEVLKDNHEQPDVSYFNPRTVGSLMQLTDSTSRPVLNNETFGSPLVREGVVGKIYGTNVKQSNQVPIDLAYGTTSAQKACSDALVGRSKAFGIYGIRRDFVWKTDYVIDNDYYKWQTTARVAFAVKYPESYCLIRGILN